MLRHPVEADGSKHFDYEFPDFAYDPWNVRLRLASYVFNLFGHMSTLNNMWPVVLQFATMEMHERNKFLHVTAQCRS